jgi:hypothetical protein
MQDIIEGDDIPLWRLLAITLRAVIILVVVTLRPKVAAQDGLSEAH